MMEEANARFAAMEARRRALTGLGSARPGAVWVDVVADLDPSRTGS
jgi:hypothetical protein